LRHSTLIVSAIIINASENGVTLVDEKNEFNQPAQYDHDDSKATESDEPLLGSIRCNVCNKGIEKIREGYYRCTGCAARFLILEIPRDQKYSITKEYSDPFLLGEFFCGSCKGPVVRIRESSYYQCTKCAATYWIYDASIPQDLRKVQRKIKKGGDYL
jgi:DNA-directed RNA polymerase subunit RPC12/RpoP